jgi:hypothetical protein
MKATVFTVIAFLFAAPFVSSQIIEDTADPRVIWVATRADRVEIEFSEEPDMPSVAAGVKVDGKAMSWLLGADRYAVTTTERLELGPHRLEISGVTDLAGKPLPEPLQLG